MVLAMLRARDNKAVSEIIRRSQEFFERGIFKTFVWEK